MITPIDSAWFSFYNNQGIIVPIQEQEIYSGLGMDRLAEKDGIDFITLEGSHMHLPMDTIKGLVDVYLSDVVAEKHILTFQE